MSRAATQPLVSFIVLNWNGLEDTKKCLKSIDQIDYPNKEVVVVDNGSDDGSKEYFGALKDIKFVDLPKNTGFTGGHIAGRKVAKGEYLAIVNNDLTLDKDWARVCLATFNRQRDAAVVGGRAYKWDDNNPAHSLENEFYSFQEIDPERGYARTLLTGGEECAVDSISGAALMIKQSALKKVGYFDDDFFAYFEEVDLAARLLRAGLKAYYNPEARTWHKIAASTSDDSSFYLYMMHRNRYFFAAKNFDDKYFEAFKNNYRREAKWARLQYLKNRKNLDAKCRIKAYRWTRQNQKMIMASRAKVQKKGNSYSKRLWRNERKDATIIITCYNYGKFVGEAIDSALGQSLTPKKVIVINDGSTDGSRKIIDKYKSNPLIEIIHKPNTGVIDSRNIGIKLSDTYWTVFLDADDKLDKTFLKQTIKTSKNGYYDIVYTDMRMFGAFDDIFKGRPFSTPTLLKANYINNSALVKTSLMKQIGGLKHEMTGGLEDWEMYVSLVEIGAKPAYLPLPLVKYRQHTEGILSRRTGYANREKELKRLMKGLHKGLYRKNNYSLAVSAKGLRLVAYTFKHPGLAGVLLRAIPGASFQGLRFINHQAQMYINDKSNQQHE
jgi:GT2 family glycosyltransferase